MDNEKSPPKLSQNTEKESSFLTHSPFSCRLLLAIVAFFSGATIMLIELTGNRILAPMFGNTLYTWTGLIGVILIAMSGGYYFGGWLADRRTHYLALINLISASAIFTFLIPLLHLISEGFLIKLSVVWGSVLASLIIFAIPAFLLGAVPPFAIKLMSLLSSDKKVGRAAGCIGMFSILGSVVGTFVTGFVLIPKIGIRAIFFTTSVGLIIIAVSGYILFLPKRKSKKYIVFCVTIIIMGLIVSRCHPQIKSNVLFDKTTFYHRIVVQKEVSSDGKHIKKLILDTTENGSQYQESKELVRPYYNYWKLSKLFSPKIEKTLFLGGGAFVMPQAVIDAYPAASVEVVEIDPEVVEVAKQFFHLDQYKQIKIIIDDARCYLNITNESYNLIFGDVYSDFTIPSHFTTKEFFHLVKNRLTKDGVYIMNIVSAIKGARSQPFLSIVKTMGEIFNNLYVYAMELNDLEKRQNIIIVGTMNKPKLTSFDEKINHEISFYIITEDPFSRELDYTAELVKNREPVSSIGAYFTTPVLGDFDSDGDVDNFDLNIYNAAVGSKKNEINYNPFCDFNNNELIEESDLALFQKNYGSIDYRGAKGGFFRWTPLASQRDKKYSINFNSFYKEGSVKDKFTITLNLIEDINNDGKIDLHDWAVDGQERIKDSMLENLLSKYVCPRDYDTSNVPLFTDDYNPLEYLVTRNVFRDGR